MSSPKVAVIGRPNVGKSTLVNRLAGIRRAITSDAPGMTRDLLDFEVEWRGQRFLLYDTGGIVEVSLASRGEERIDELAARRALEAAGDAQLVLLVADAQVGPQSGDDALSEELRRRGILTLLVVNKADDAMSEAQASSFWGLGLGEPIAVSALHGRGTGDLLDRVVEKLPEAAYLEPEGDIPTLAIVGRPNVGKSSLFNRVCRDERALVHHLPGTTRDPIDSVVSFADATYRFVDTAGIRRATKTKGAEVFSASRTRTAIRRADLAVLVVDGAEGATSQDQRIARMISESGAAAILAVNKWDLVEDPGDRSRVDDSLRDRLGFIAYAPLVRTSAKTGRGIEKLLEALPEVLAAREKKAPTSRLNRVLMDAQQRTPPPRSSGRNIKILYATQIRTSPPTFALFTTGDLPDSWLRYLEKELREAFGFVGNPLRFDVRPRAQR